MNLVSSSNSTNWLKKMTCLSISVFAGKPLETQTIRFAMIANEIGMRGVYSMSSASSAV